MKLEQACEIIDTRVPVCPSCGDSDIEIFVDTESFGGPEIFVPVHSCKKSSFKWTDDIGGQVWQKKIKICLKLNWWSNRMRKRS